MHVSEGYGVHKSQPSVSCVPIDFNCGIHSLSNSNSDIVHLAGSSVQQIWQDRRIIMQYNYSQDINPSSCVLLRFGVSHKCIINGDRGYCLKKFLWPLKVAKSKILYCWYIRRWVQNKTLNTEFTVYIKGKITAFRKTTWLYWMITCRILLLPANIRNCQRGLVSEFVSRQCAGDDRLNVSNIGWRIGYRCLGFLRHQWPLSLSWISNYTHYFFTT